MTIVSLRFRPVIFNSKFLNKFNSNSVIRCLSTTTLISNDVRLLNSNTHKTEKTSNKIPTNTQQHHKRFLFSKLADTLGGGKPGKKLRYEEKHLLGYSMEQMYTIVSQVEHYHEFVPWCKESSVSRGSSENSFDCRLTVGFPPLLERYNSRVTTIRPFEVKSVCSDGMLFNHLLTIWSFSPGLDPSKKNTCVLGFFVEFQFKLSLHSQLTQLFFDEVIKKMVRAFFKRAETLYGPQSVKSERLKVVLHEES